MSVFACGCAIYRGEIVFCALHSAAEEMRDLLQLHDDYSTMPSEEFSKKYPKQHVGSYELMQRRRRLLEKVKR